jgi:hypothetical protein
MQRMVFAAAMLVLFTGCKARADDQADSKALISKAIKAAGGKENLAKYRAQTFKGKGKFYGMGDGIDYTGDWALQIPNCMRVQIEINAGGMKFTIVRVFNGAKAWNKVGDQVMEVTDADEIAEAKADAYAQSVTSLLPLLGKDFEFAPLGEAKVDGKPAVGVRVSHKGQRDINLFFDKDKNLLVKTEYVIKDIMAGGKEVTQEAVYSNHKEIKGMLFPFAVVIHREGKKFLDAELTELEPKEKLDDSVFEKP